VAAAEIFGGHKKMHDAFVLSILKTVTGNTQATYGDCVAFVKFLSDWIFSHIAQEDKKYAPFVLEHIKNGGELAAELQKEDA
jgi:hemerythrin